MARCASLPKYVEDNFLIEDEIAKGKFGVVYKGQEKDTKEEVAVKIMMRRHNKREDVTREVEILKRLEHPRILNYRSFKEDGGNYILVTEMLSGGELFDYCTSKDYLMEGEAVLFMKQILDGLAYLHARKICHLDLKPENIVLKSADSKDIKIIDFGTARDLSEAKDVQVMVGTPEFIAPEVLNYDPVSVAADMWAIGVITFCLLTGCSPFLGDNDGETIQNVTSGEYEFPESDEDESYEDISDAAKDFIEKMLILNPRKRITAENALKHRWIGVLQRSIAGQSRINTERLRRLRRRRKLLAAIQAVRLSVGLFRTFSRTSSISSSSSNGTTTSKRPNAPLPTFSEQSSPSPSPSPESSTNGSTAGHSKTLPNKFSGPLSPLGKNGLTSYT